MALVDIEMPRMDGFELSRKILRFSDLPIILLTGVSDEGAVVTGLREVAEDYVTKPFRRAELLARVERVLRRMGDFGYTAEPDIEIDERLVVSLASRMAVLDGETIKLTPTEAKLLYILLKFAGRTVQTEYLLRRIWPLEEAFEDRLHAVVYRLRKKLEENPKEPRYIVADWSRGYVLPISA